MCCKVERSPNYHPLNGSFIKSWKSKHCSRGLQQFGGHCKDLSETANVKCCCWKRSLVPSKEFRQGLETAWIDVFSYSLAFVCCWHKNNKLNLATQCLFNDENNYLLLIVLEVATNIHVSHWHTASSQQTFHLSRIHMPIHSYNTDVSFLYIHLTARHTPLESQVNSMDLLG